MAPTKHRNNPPPVTEESDYWYKHWIDDLRVRHHLYIWILHAHLTVKGVWRIAQANPTAFNSLLHSLKDDIDNSVVDSDLLCYIRRLHFCQADGLLDTYTMEILWVST